ncbi:AAA family ATPase [Curtobacterium sp. Csp1]|uniref:ATP-dependent nuclease n=1 Tax=Curtobacterium sp. Csp1 TaxID=2495429 RepID=UPI0015976E83|nr:ATP-binding protein [Curtobacterium sp. Csp1]QKS18867.1 AAA family ATPase [Curtobacterium sp. Csp1]
MKLKNVTLTNGIQVSISESITAIVGPNNAGKSTFLREIQQIFARQPYQGPVIGHRLIQSYDLEGDDEPNAFEAFRQRLDANNVRREPGAYNDGAWDQEHWKLSNGQVVLESHVRELWNSRHGFGPLSSYMSILMDANNRLHLANSTPAYDALRDSPSSAVQRLYSDRELEATLSALTAKAFGVPLTVNRYAGSQIYLHVGAPSAVERESPQSKEYLEQLAGLPLIDEQGDGFRAFIGMALSVIAGSYPLVLIDEPEAFLHPPQARLLGQFLAEQHATGTQVIVSTHSEDVVAGMTSGEDQRVAIVRLTRDADKASIAQLAPDDVKKLYDDPLIRYYDMLNGLFVRGVVICEADSDCTYYRAVIDNIDAKAGMDSGLHFTHAGGKSRVHVALEAFRRTEVPVVSILDIDLLQDDQEFTRIVEAAGAQKSDLERDRNVIVAYVKDRDQKKTVTAAAAEIKEHLDAATGEVTSSLVGRITKSLSGRSGWKDFKLQGSSMLQGDALNAFTSLDSKLRSYGVFLVPVGELEGFHREYPAANKARWLRSVLEAKAFAIEGEAKEFLRSVIAYASSKQVQS